MIAVEQNKIILLVNSGYRKLETEMSDGDGGGNKREIMKPLLGKCWVSVPDIRLLIERLTDADKKRLHCRRIRMHRISLNNRHVSAETECTVTITNAGII